MHTCARVCICVHVSAHTSVVVGWPASVSMHTRARLCTRVHACVFGRGEACVHTRVRVHACARGVCDGWAYAHTRARVVLLHVQTRGWAYEHTRAHACTRVHARVHSEGRGGCVYGWGWVGASGCGWV